MQEEGIVIKYKPVIDLARILGQWIIGSMQASPVEQHKLFSFPITPPTILCILSIIIGTSFLTYLETIGFCPKDLHQFLLIKFRGLETQKQAKLCGNVQVLLFSSVLGWKGMVEFSRGPLHL